MNKININNNLINKVNIPTLANKIPIKEKASQGIEFDKILKEKVDKQNNLKFSKHAQQRLNARNIVINNAQIQKINEAVTKAEEKGIKDTLILMDDTALVASVKNRTIITAIQSKELKDNVFTNIDGAVII